MQSSFFGVTCDQKKKKKEDDDDDDDDEGEDIPYLSPCILLDLCYSCT
jgi:hypothetical protein